MRILVAYRPNRTMDLSGDDDAAGSRREARAPKVGAPPGLRRRPQGQRLVSSDARRPTRSDQQRASGVKPSCSDRAAARSHAQAQSAEHGERG